MLGDGGREQGVEHHAHVAGAGNAHDEALLFGRIPAARLRQGHREGSAAEAENGAEHRDRVGAAQAVDEDIETGQGHDGLGDRACQLGADGVGENAHGDAQNGA